MNEILFVVEEADDGEAPPLIRLHHVRQEVLALRKYPEISTVQN